MKEQYPGTSFREQSRYNGMPKLSRHKINGTLIKIFGKSDISRVKRDGKYYGKPVWIHEKGHN